MSPITSPLNPNDNNINVTNLKSALNILIEKQQLALGTEDSLNFPNLLNKEKGYGESTKHLVSVFQQLNQLPETGGVDEATASAFNKLLQELGAFDGNINGYIYMDYGLPANNVKLRLYAKGFGGQDTMVTEANTNEQGNYSFNFSPANVPSANFEVRAVDVSGNEHGLSNTLYGNDKAAGISDLNLIAPTIVQPVEGSEFSRLSKDVSAVIGDISKLNNAQEKDDRQDITFLSQNTNWDARTIALASLAGKLSETTGLTQEAAYAIVRAGLPTDADHLAQISSDDVSEAIKKASEAGIVAIDKENQKAAVIAYEKFSNQVRLGAKDFSSLSSYDDLLNSQNLSDTEKTAFANVYFAPRNDAADLWKKAKDAGIPEDKIKGLQLQGKLGMLTANNAPLVQNLQGIVNSANDLSKLVDEGLYEPDAWDAKLKTLAGTDDDNAEAIEKLIPPAYIGGSIAERKDAYVTDMAAKVREAFPEKVIISRIEKGKIKLGNDATQKKISDFLSKAESLGYQIGTTHIDSFVADKGDALFNGATTEQKTTTLSSVKLLTRIHQVTPNDESMQMLLELGHSSAQDIIAVPKDDFISRFGKEYSDKYKVSLNEGMRIGKLVYNKSQQVFTTTYSFYSATQTMQQTPPVFAISGTPERQAEDQQALSEKINGAPTLQQLFGSLDFCECEHCRSVLSPAAYLVDLLQFLDRKETDWQYFLDKWKKDHGGENYEAKFSKPYDALIDRRPDIINLPLTCENTETALPYIDVVNEILEYYVVNKKLTIEVAHDTGNATTPELLAEPQNIAPEAYGILKQSTYPISLPFDLWIETVRQFCNQYDTPLWQVLKTIQPITGSDFNTQRKIAVESLNISPVEYAIFSNEDPLADLFNWYGYANDADMTAALKSAKTLADKLGVTYKELYSLVQTVFINPQWKELVLLQKMSVTVNEVFRYKNAAGFIPFTDDEKQAFEDNLAHIKSLYGTDAKKAVDKVWDDGVFTQILLLNDTNAGCSFDATVVGYADRDALKFDWLKFNLFVRLWKKLGWTIDETDTVLNVFLAANLKKIFNDTTKDENARAKALTKAVGSALINIAHLKLLASKVNAGKNVYIKLSTLWGDIPSLSKNSLYSQLFLSRNLLKIDTVFDNALGQYLSEDIIIKNPEKDHSIAIQAALNITSTDLEQILNNNGQDIKTAALSLSNVSLLYRYALLAKSLKMSVPDLIALKQLSGMDPFAALSPDPLQSADDDHLLNQTLQFIDLALKVKDSGYKLEDINYLLKHQFESTGKYRNTGVEADAVVRLLANEITRIQSGYALPSNPADASDLTPYAGFTDDILQQNLSLIVSSNSVQTFMAMWTAKQEADWNKLKDDFDDFFSEEKFNSLFIPDAGDADDTTKQISMLQKRSTFAKAVLPFIQQKLIQQSIMQVLATALGTQPAIIEWIITDASRLHNSSRPADALIETFLEANNILKATDVSNAFLLLGKVIQLTKGFQLSDKELQYVTLNGKDFSNLSLSNLPAENNLTPDSVQASFAAFTRLADYVNLRKNLTGGGDDLIDIFAQARVHYDAGQDVDVTKENHLNNLYQKIASLTRRDIAMVTAVGKSIGINATNQIEDAKLLISVDAFADERGIGLLWNMLKTVQIFGVPVETLSDVAQIIAPNLADEKYQSIAESFKNAVKARYELEAWQQIAQPIFDKLRQQRRNALVAYLLHNFSNLFTSMEEMYEYFLVDPGTEPVVQTSRIRLATASVQLFIQRCLLNLENRWEKKVPPAAINAKHWQWMNRYRVWEANRKIFLWPENWLEPEWRDDKTHLFKELEGKLLQGDVSSDLVETGFYVYLQKLEELARLNIIALYCEEDPVTPEANMLHVLGRSYGFPHKYFYRKYAQKMWTPWEPVDTEIDGNHIVIVKWRGRMHIFWVTFIEKIEGDNIQPVGTSSSTKLKNWKVNDALSTVTSGANTKKIEAHLHWSEYYQGKWSTKQSNGLDNPVSATVSFNLSPRGISITVSKEPNITDEIDGALRISLNGLGGFRVVSKNSPPEIISAESQPAWKFTAGSYEINRLSVDDNKLSVSFPHLIKTLNGDEQEIHSDPQTILGKTIGDFNLVPCSEPVTMGGEEFGPLVTPFFYQDSWYTFYTEPSLTETITINQWDEWVGGPPVVYKPKLVDWGKIKMDPYYPWPKNIPLPKDAGDPGWIDPGDSRIKVSPALREDWATNPNTYVKFDERVIGKDTGMNVVLNNDSQPVLVKDGNLLNTIIHNTQDSQNILLIPADKSVTDLSNKSLSDGNVIKESAGIKTDVLLVGGAGISSTKTVGTGVGQQTGGIFGKNLFQNKSLNKFSL